MASRVTSPTFVGRRDELHRVATALGEVRRGEPRVVLVGGEAGVGKTRFVHEVERLATSAGIRVLEGGCLPFAGEGLPYGAVIEALRGLSGTVDRVELERMAGSGQAELARLMPELGSSVHAASAGADGSGQGRLFEHLLRFLAELGQRGPVAIVLEDIHWADDSTLQLLVFLARNLRSTAVLLVATYRTDELQGRHPLRPVLAELERSHRVERLVLAPFDRHELANQLEGILGVPPEPDVLSRIAARSEGNAFYAEELLAAGPNKGKLPATLREVLLARVATLNEPAQELVRVASAAGQEIRSARLASVTGFSDLHLEHLLREAVSSHVLLLHESPAGARLTFRHALVQEAVYGELLPGERLRLHAAFARAISDERARENDSTGAAELAYHWQAAHDLPRAFEAWVAAGLAAETIYATSEAQASFEHALELWDQVPDAAARAPLDRVELLMRAAFHAEGPAPTRSISHIRQAIALVDASTDPTRAGLLHERLGQYGSSILDVGAIVAAYEEAVRLVPAEPPSAARSWVLSGLGRCYASEVNRPAEAVALCEEALSVARAAGAREVESRALVPLGSALVQLGDAEVGLACVRRAYEIAVELGDANEAAGALAWLGAELQEVGRNEESAATRLRAIDYAVRHGLAARWATNATLQLAWALIDRGRWDEAAAALAQVRQYELTGERELAAERALLTLAMLQGDFDEADQHARRARLLAERSAGRDPFLGLVLSAFALSQGDPLAARAAIPDVGDLPGFPPRGLRPIIISGITAEAELAALARSRHDEVALAEALARGTAYFAQAKGLSADRATGEPDLRLRDVAEQATCEAEFSRLEARPDPDRWASAAAAWEALDMPYERGYALMREAEATLAQARDRSRAGRALNQARAIATALGAAPLVRETERLAVRARIALDAVDGRRDSPVAKVTPERHRPSMARLDDRAKLVRRRRDLTPREREVLALVGAGRSNDEIGEILFVSGKTVSVHIANIKAKLGASSRVAMAIYAIESGMVEGRASASVE